MLTPPSPETEPPSATTRAKVPASSGASVADAGLDCAATPASPAPSTQIDRYQTGPIQITCRDTLQGTSPVLSIEDFELEKRIGAGGIAEVWMARHPYYEQPVALKIARAHLADNPHVHAQFEREQRAADLLSHRGLIRHLGAGTTPSNQPFLVMEVVWGPSLSHFVRRPVSWRFLRAALVQLCETLQFIHDQGVFHQDLKPANVLVDLRVRQVKVTDFGLARFERASADATTRHVLGTPAYMAPEQARGQLGRLGPHTDLYTVGVLLFELLSGHKPFSGDGDHAVMLQHCTQTLPPLEIREGIGAPDAVYNVVKRLLSKKPEARYSSASSLRKVLLALR